MKKDSFSLIFFRWISRSKPEITASTQSFTQTLNYVVERAEEKVPKISFWCWHTKKDAFDELKIWLQQQAFVHQWRVRFWLFLTLNGYIFNWIACVSRVPSQDANRRLPLFTQLKTCMKWKKCISSKFLLLRKCFLVCKWKRLTSYMGR